MLRVGSKLVDVLPGLEAGDCLISRSFRRCWRSITCRGCKKVTRRFEDTHSSIALAGFVEHKCTRDAFVVVPRGRNLPAIAMWFQGQACAMLYGWWNRPAARADVVLGQRTAVIQHCVGAHRVRGAAPCCRPPIAPHRYGASVESCVCRRHQAASG